MNSFYLHRTNWHSWPPLSRLLCWIGRHDYEFVKVEAEPMPQDENWRAWKETHKCGCAPPLHDAKWALLECIYCGQTKKSLRMT